MNKYVKTCVKALLCGLAVMGFSLWIGVGIGHGIVTGVRLAL